MGHTTDSITTLSPPLDCVPEVLGTCCTNTDMLRLDFHFHFRGSWKNCCGDDGGPLWSASVDPVGWCRWLKMSAWQTACLLKTSAGNLYLTVTPVIFVGNAPGQGQRCAGVSNCLGGWRRGWGRGRGGDGECSSNNQSTIYNLRSWRRRPRSWRLN